MDKYIPYGKDIRNKKTINQVGSSINMKDFAKSFKISKSLTNTEQYTSLNVVEILSEGSEFSDNTTVSAPNPTMDGGIQATFVPKFGLTRQSISISGDTTKVNAGDSFLISSDDEDNTSAAVLRVLNKKENGELIFVMEKSGSGFSNNSILEVTHWPSSMFNLDLSYGEQNIEILEELTFTLIPNKFCISELQITNPGRGYSLNKPILLTSSGEGRNFSAMASGMPFYEEVRVDTNIPDKLSIDRSRPPRQNKFNKTVVDHNHYQKVVNNVPQYVINQPIIDTIKNTNTSQINSYQYDKTSKSWIGIQNNAEDSSSSSSCKDNRCENEAIINYVSVMTMALTGIGALGVTGYFLDRLKQIQLDKNNRLLKEKRARRARLQSYVNENAKELYYRIKHEIRLILISKEDGRVTLAMRRSLYRRLSMIMTTFDDDLSIPGKDGKHRLLYPGRFSSVSDITDELDQLSAAQQRALCKQIYRNVIQRFENSKSLVNRIGNRGKETLLGVLREWSEVFKNRRKGKKVELPTKRFFEVLAQTGGYEIEFDPETLSAGGDSDFVKEVEECEIQIEVDQKRRKRRTRYKPPSFWKAFKEFKAKTFLFRKRKSRLQGISRRIPIIPLLYAGFEYSTTDSGFVESGFNAFSPVTTHDWREFMDSLNDAPPDTYFSIADYQQQLNNIAIKADGLRLALCDGNEADAVLRAQISDLLDKQVYTLTPTDGNNPNEEIIEDEDGNLFAIKEYGDEDKIAFLQAALSALNTAREQAEDNPDLYFWTDTISETGYTEAKAWLEAMEYLEELDKEAQLDPAYYGPGSPLDDRYYGPDASSAACTCSAEEFDNLREKFGDLLGNDPVTNNGNLLSPMNYSIEDNETIQQLETDFLDFYR